MSIHGLGGTSGIDRLSAADAPTDVPASPQPQGSSAARGSGHGGRMAAALSVTTPVPPTPSPGTPPVSAADLAVRVAALPRGAVIEPYLNDIVGRLAGRVTTRETEVVLDLLEQLDGPEWLAMIEKLGALPSDEVGFSQLEKLVRYGVNDRNSFIAQLADQANRKLGLGLPTLEDRIARHRGDGESCGRAERLANREVREENRLILDYFAAEDKQGFWNGVRAAGEDTVNAVGAALALPLLLIVWGRNDR